MSEDSGGVVYNDSRVLAAILVDDLTIAYFSPDVVSN
jgi:hypothetical protein